MSMFCFQCEQTAGGKCCSSISGVCGKKEQTANFQDDLMDSLIALAVSNNKTPEIMDIIISGLFSTITNVNFDDKSIKKLIKEAELLTKKQAFKMSDLWTDNEDIRSLKSLILFGLKGIAAYAYHAKVLGYQNEEVNDFFYTGLRAIAQKNKVDELLPLVLETGRINLLCMELLDKANTETYGHPVPTKITTNIEKGPFIVVSGHDLHDLYLLLKQTETKGVNVYTHGEMLPCHAYPKLKQFKHLKGNFGTAWQNQQKEFSNVPGAFLFTTNCIMPVKESYADRVFTTALVEYPDIVHIGEDKDFSPVINKAIELGGYSQEHKMEGINGGNVLTVGFGHNAVLSSADKIISAIKDGKIRHIFLVGGCDGAKPGRNYYTDFVKKTPKDTLILTLACGKYRFNDLDLGTIEGLPRILDMGQCNDAYSAIKVATELSKAFNCSVNDLPLSLILSWYEQKAVCILLTLLHLGIKNIKLGPTLPAFISPNILKVLIDKYNISLITTPEEDLKKILK